MREMLALVASQFKELVASGLPAPGMDLQAGRFAVALLHQDKDQLASPGGFCELFTTVNEELGDFLAMGLSVNLIVWFPDRLDRMLDSYSFAGNRFEEWRESLLTRTAVTSKSPITARWSWR